MVNKFPRETVEFQPVVIRVDGVIVTTGVQFDVTPYGDRPSTWANPTQIDDEIGVMVTGYTAGQYTVWAKVTSAPETPVIDCGYFIVT